MLANNISILESKEITVGYKILSSVLSKGYQMHNISDKVTSLNFVASSSLKAHL